MTPAVPLVNPRVLLCPQCGRALGVQSDDFLQLGAVLLNSRARLICACCRNLWGWRPGDALRGQEPAAGP